MAKNFKSFVQWAILNAKTKITELAKSELSNAEKKKRLDSYLMDIITVNFDYYMPSGIIAKFCYKYVVTKLILPHISEFTQMIYDLLKAKIDGVTK